MNDEKKDNNTKLGIVFSIIGIIASIVMIILYRIDNKSTVLGIILLCSCSANLIANVNNKKNNNK